MSGSLIPPPNGEGYDAGDVNHVKRARVEQKRRDKMQSAVVSALMETTEGRAWLWDFLGACGVYESPFATNELQMAYKAGRGDVGRRLLADIVQFAPEGYLRMIKEHQSSE